MNFFFYFEIQWNICFLISETHMPKVYVILPDQHKLQGRIIQNNTRKIFVDSKTI